MSVRLTGRADSAVSFLVARMREPRPHPALVAMTEGRVSEYAGSDSGALCLSVEMVASLLGWQPPPDEEPEK